MAWSVWRSAHAALASRAPAASAAAAAVPLRAYAATLRARRGDAASRWMWRASATASAVPTGTRWGGPAGGGGGSAPRWPTATTPYSPAAACATASTDDTYAWPTVERSAADGAASGGTAHV